MAVIKGRGNGETKIGYFEGGQSKEDRNAGWRLLPRTNRSEAWDGPGEGH